jgi:hypothetical protein
MMGVRCFWRWYRRGAGWVLLRRERERQRQTDIERDRERDRETEGDDLRDDWAGERVRTPNQVLHPWAATGCREVAPPLLTPPTRACAPVAGVRPDASKRARTEGGSGGTPAGRGGGGGGGGGGRGQGRDGGSPWGAGESHPPLPSSAPPSLPAMAKAWLAELYAIPIALASRALPTSPSTPGSRVVQRCKQLRIVTIWH